MVVFLEPVERRALNVAASLVLHLAGGHRIQDDEQTADELTGQAACGEEDSRVVVARVEVLFDEPLEVHSVVGQTAHAWRTRVSVSSSPIRFRSMKALISSR